MMEWYIVWKPHISSKKISPSTCNYFPCELVTPSARDLARFVTRLLRSFWPGKGSKIPRAYIDDMFYGTTWCMMYPVVCILKFQSSPARETQCTFFFSWHVLLSQFDHKTIPSYTWPILWVNQNLTNNVILSQPAGAPKHIKNKAIRESSIKETRCIFSSIVPWKL